MLETCKCVEKGWRHKVFSKKMFPISKFPVSLGMYTHTHTHTHTAAKILHLKLCHQASAACDHTFDSSWRRPRAQHHSSLRAASNHTNIASTLLLTCHSCSAYQLAGHKLHNHRKPRGSLDCRVSTALFQPSTW